MVSILHNNSTSGSINNFSFAQKVAFDCGNGLRGIAIADLDGDGEPDLVSSNQGSGIITVLRHTTLIQLCPPLMSNILNSNLSGTNYQWQVNSGNGFINIGNDSNYSGATTPNLNLNNVPSSWNGHQYRCVVDGNNTGILIIKFLNTWIGSVNSSWENPVNWSCGTLPDRNTDVIIDSGTVVINSNAKIKSLQLSTGVNFTVSAGYTFTVTH